MKKHRFEPMPGWDKCARCGQVKDHENHQEGKTDAVKAQEFLDRHGELVMGALSTDVQNLCDMRDDAARNGWHTIRKTCQEQIDQGIAAMQELELLRGEG